MQIHHIPQFDTAKVIEHYEQQDGVPITYICTTDIVASDVPMDVFYRESPHPEFGNRYFGLYYRNGSLMITSADRIEELDFGMVAGDDGMLHYSQSHHDYKEFNNGNMIDGGRAYCRSSVMVEFYSVKNGSFIRNFGEELTNLIKDYESNI